jgi:hypothetical protein
VGVGQGEYGEKKAEKRQDVLWKASHSSAFIPPGTGIP